MEAKKEAAPSSSLATELLGPKESSPSSSSSSALFDSIFPPPSKAYTRDYISYQQPKKNYDSTPKGDCLDNEDKIHNVKMTDLRSFYEQDVPPPCTLSSSLYYGGQDIYINPGTAKNTTAYYSTKHSIKDGEDDGFASRGNWWMGGLYY